ncbi:MAG: hypothetical protein J6S78_00560, partial [Lachnospiraceae bacterium]|nr:hypothetical protein [Lachnospiraceae bacterium]
IFKVVSLFSFQGSRLKKRSLWGVSKSDYITTYQQCQQEFSSFFSGFFGHFFYHNILSFHAPENHKKQAKTELPGGFCRGVSEIIKETTSTSAQDERRNRRNLP